VDLLGPCGAFTESCRPLTFSLSPAGTPESESFPPDVLSYRPLVDLAASRGLRGVDLPVKGPCFAQLVESHTGKSPRTPSVVFQTYEPKPLGDALTKVCSTIESTPAPIRLLSIRARTSGGATDFFLASALFDHRPDLRPTGEEDARCVEPTSATHSNYVHPHLARSQLTTLVAQRGRPTETKAPYGTIGGPDVSRHPRPLRRIVTAS
jgi:hypothetical protein